MNAADMWGLGVSLLIASGLLMIVARRESWRRGAVLVTGCLGIGLALASVLAPAAARHGPGPMRFQTTIWRG